MQARSLSPIWETEITCVAPFCLEVADEETQHASLSVFLDMMFRSHSFSQFLLFYKCDCKCEDVFLHTKEQMTANHQELLLNMTFVDIWLK